MDFKISIPAFKSRERYSVINASVEAVMIVPTTGGFNRRMSMILLKCLFFLYRVDRKTMERRTMMII